MLQGPATQTKAPMKNYRYGICLFLFIYILYIYHELMAGVEGEGVVTLDSL